MPVHQTRLKLAEQYGGIEAKAKPAQQRDSYNCRFKVWRSNHE
jgi:hypothetical protein